MSLHETHTFLLLAGAMDADRLVQDLDLRSVSEWENFLWISWALSQMMISLKRHREFWWYMYSFSLHAILYKPIKFLGHTFFHCYKMHLFRAFFSSTIINSFIWYNIVFEVMNSRTHKRKIYTLKAVKVAFDKSIQQSITVTLFKPPPKKWANLYNVSQWGLMLFDYTVKKITTFCLKFLIDIKFYLIQL